MKKLFYSLFIASIIFSATSFSQDEKNYSLKNKHAITLGFGMRTNSNSTVIRNYTTWDRWDDHEIDINTGFMGELSYNYWFDEEWAINFQVGVIGANVDANYITEDLYDDDEFSANTITPVVMGFRYYPKTISLGNVGRPYAGLNFGAYVGTSTNHSNYLYHETVIETVFGVEPHVGVDFFIAKWLRLGPCLSYHLHSKFKAANVDNDNTFGFTVNMGVVF